MTYRKELSSLCLVFLLRIYPTKYVTLVSSIWQTVGSWVKPNGVESLFIKLSHNSYLSLMLYSIFIISGSGRPYRNQFLYQFPYMCENVILICTLFLTTLIALITSTYFCLVKSKGSVILLCIDPISY